MQVTNRNIIRFLSGLSFLIFFCPFFQMCSDKELKENPFSKCNTNQRIVNTKNYSKEDLNKLNEKHLIEQEKLFIKTKKEFTRNAYEIAFKNSSELSFKEFISLFRNIDTYGFLCYIFIILMSLLIVIYSIKIIALKKILILVTINLVLLFSSKLFFFLHGNLEDINQIKIGYYLFLLNSILILYFCRKELKINP